MIVLAVWTMYVAGMIVIMGVIALTVIIYGSGIRLGLVFFGIHKHPSGLRSHLKYEQSYALRNEKTDASLGRA